MRRAVSSGPPSPRELTTNEGVLAKRALITPATLTAVAALAGGLSAASAATHSAARAAMVKPAASSLGRVLVDGRGRTSEERR